MAAAGFISLSELYFTICLMPYNPKYNVLSASLNKTFPSFVRRDRERGKILFECYV